MQPNGHSVLDFDRAVLERAFQSRSRSVPYMEKRLLEAVRCLDSLATMGFAPWKVTEWQMATFIHKFSKNKGEGNADTRFFRDQVRDSPKGETKRHRHAKPLDEKVITTFEKLVECAETPQLGCAAGLFALLAHTSHCGLDGIR